MCRLRKVFRCCMTRTAARRRAFDGEKVPKGEKVFSIFEPHTELIMRGRRGQPIEFGHKVLLTQSKEKFITDFVVEEENRPDEELLQVVLDRHQEKYGQRPKSIAADKGLCPDADTYEELEEQVDFLGVPRRSRDYGDSMMVVWQQWRAGIEGTISCLKRAFRLARCCFRGFKNFASAIGSAVFCPQSEDSGKNLWRVTRRHHQQQNTRPEHKARYARYVDITPHTPQKPPSPASLRASGAWL